MPSAALFVIVWSAVATFLLLKLVGLLIPLRMSEENMEIGDTAEHGHRDEKALTSESVPERRGERSDDAGGEQPHEARNSD